MRVLLQNNKNNRVCCLLGLGSGFCVYLQICMLCVFVVMVRLLQDVLMRGLSMASSRKRRQDARNVMEKSLNSLVNSARAYANEVSQCVCVYCF